MSERIESIKKQFLELEEVKRIKELENYIDNNVEINKLFFEIKSIQKKMVNAKEFNQYNQLNIYNKEYIELKSKLLDMPFVEEYLELLEMVNNMLLDVVYQIENKIDINLNK